jgi:hypothetical protein
MTYESIPGKRDTSVTSQGLAARLCDNYEYSGDQLNPDLRPLIYCDKGAIEQYLNWFETHGCDYSRSDYDASGFKSRARDGRVVYRPTKAHPSIIHGLEDVSDDEGGNELRICSNTFPAADLAKTWAVDNMNWSGEWNKKAGDDYSPAVYTVGTCNLEGGNGTTHLRRRVDNVPEEIQSDEDFRRDNRLGRFGGKVRCVPVRVNEALGYIIIYKASWLRVANGGAGRAQ